MELPPRSSNLVVLESVSLVLIDAVAIGGSAFICLATARNPSLRTNTNLWVTALALSDLFRSCITAPMTIGTLICGEWSYGAAGCIAQGFFTYFLTLVSLPTMACMAVNRYYRVVKPQLYLKIFTKKRTMIILLFLWSLMAFIVSLPVFAQWAEFSFHSGYAACVIKFHAPAFTITFLALDTCCILLPCLVAITGCYFKVSRAVRKHNFLVVTSLQRTRKLPQSGAGVEEIRVTKTLFLLVSTFAICWIPAYAIGFLSLGNLIHIAPQAALLVTYLVGLNSACNPFIYGYMNRSYRTEFRKVFSLRRRKNQIAPHLEIRTLGLSVT